MSTFVTHNFVLEGNYTFTQITTYAGVGTGTITLLQEDKVAGYSYSVSIFDFVINPNQGGVQLPYAYIG